MNTFFKKIKIATAVVMLFLASCTQTTLYENNSNIPSMQWKSNVAATGDFLINDTTSNYNLFIVIRHTDAYDYNNIWLNVGLQTPGVDSLQYQKVNVPLGADDTGWKGIGMNDIWEIRAFIARLPANQLKKGSYKYSIYQIMRDNPLLHVMSVGLRIEKAP